VQPTAIQLVAVTQMSLGADHGCATTADGVLWCWGDASRGQVGHGEVSTAPVKTPTRVTGWGCP
jgi:alpha-tubulin suppressor-like RCC1 family protein